MVWVVSYSAVSNGQAAMLKEDRQQDLITLLDCDFERQGPSVSLSTMIGYSL